MYRDFGVGTIQSWNPFKNENYLKIFGGEEKHNIANPELSVRTHRSKITGF